MRLGLVGQASRRLGGFGKSLSVVLLEPSVDSLKLVDLGFGGLETGEMLRICRSEVRGEDVGGRKLEIVY